MQYEHNSSPQCLGHECFCWARERDYGEIITPEKDEMAFSYSTTRKMFLRVKCKEAGHNFAIEGETGRARAMQIHCHLWSSRLGRHLLVLTVNQH